MTVSGKEECKVRGFTLNWKNSKLINFEAIRDMICTSRKSVVTVSNPNKICRDSRKRKLYNQCENCLHEAKNFVKFGYRSIWILNRKVNNNVFNRVLLIFQH